MSLARPPFEGGRAAGTVRSAESVLGSVACWDNSQDRAREARFLDALQLELEENLNIIRSAIDQHELYANSAEHLMDISLGLAERPDADSDLMPLLGPAFLGYRTTNIQFGTLNALLSSGDIGLIGDLEIRRRPAALPGIIEDATEDERDYVEQRLHLNLPFLYEHLPDFYLSPPRRSQLLPPELDRPAVAELFGNDEFESLLGNSLQMNRTAAAALDRAADSMSELLVLIERRL